MASLNVERAVGERYSEAAAQREAALCCPVEYDARYLEVIPAEVIERDYGCGDPSAYLKPGETVLDLGSGTGKICFIASQVVGPEGRVIGVDMNAEMLGVARRAAPLVAERIGYGNVEFREGKIQDLAFDAMRVAERLRTTPVATAEDALAFEAFVDEQRVESPLITDASVDVVVSNCVLNLVSGADKARLFEEIFRVTRVGGRVVISDIVSDEDVPEHMATDAELWSGCISGALREDEFVKAFVRVGFHGARILKRDAEPWRTVEGIEFRSLTVEAFKGKQGACLEGNHAVVYKGPFSKVSDDGGHNYPRGVRSAVCEKTFRLLTRAPYAEHFEAVPPRVAVPVEVAQPFVCTGSKVRSPRETKGESYRETVVTAEDCCAPKEPGGSSGNCC